MAAVSCCQLLEHLCESTSWGRGGGVGGRVVEVDVEAGLDGRVVEGVREVAVEVVQMV